MTCPICGGSNVCAGTLGECDATYRRRRCNKCGHVFFTIEHDIDSADEYLRLEREYVAQRKKKAEIMKMRGSGDERN